MQWFISQCRYISKMRSDSGDATTLFSLCVENTLSNGMLSVGDG